MVKKNLKKFIIDNYPDDAAQFKIILDALNISEAKDDLEITLRRARAKGLLRAEALENVNTIYAKLEVEEKGL